MLPIYAPKDPGRGRGWMEEEEDHHLQLIVLEIEFSISPL